MAYIDRTPTAPIPVLAEAGAAAETAESSRRAESVSMTAATLMDRAGRAGASRSGPSGEVPESASEDSAPGELASVHSLSAWAASGESGSDGSVSMHEAMPMDGWAAEAALPPDDSAADELAKSSGIPPADPVSGHPTSAGRLVRPRWQVIAVTALIVVAFALIARNLTSGDDGSGGGGGDGGAQLTFPVDGRTTAVIHIDSGADSIVVGTAELGDELAVVTTPGGPDSGVRPQARLDGDQLRVSTDDIGDAKNGTPVQINVRLA